MAVSERRLHCRRGTSSDTHPGAPLFRGDEAIVLARRQAFERSLSIFRITSILAPECKSREFGKDLVRAALRNL